MDADGHSSRANPWVNDQGLVAVTAASGPALLITTTVYSKFAIFSQVENIAKLRLLIATSHAILAAINV